MIDVAIVGGGPSGLLAATRLAESGLDVLLFEEHPKVGDPTHCTGIVSLETAQYAKIPDDLVLSRVTRARLVGPAGAGADLVWGAPGGEAILAIDRAGFDQGLAREAMDAGALLRLGTAVTDIATADDGVVVQTAQGAVHARACVLACGVSYRFQRQLGLGLPGQAIHTAQVEMAAVPDDVVGIHFGRHVAPNGFVWTVPVVRDGRARLKIGVLASGNAAGFLQAFLDLPATRSRLLEPPPAPVRRLLPLKPIAKTYSDRVLVVGDAGGFTKPTTGGGIFYSLLTASLAAETLVEGFHAGRLDDAFLSRYERRWHEQLGSELRVGDWLRSLVTRCSDAEIDRLVTTLASDDVHALMQRTARFNWHRDLIVAVARHPIIAALLFRSLFR